MKIPAILTCLLAVLLALMPVPRAHAAEEVSFDIFYNNLADDGDWYNTPEYGYVWQPSIAYHNDKWRPYTDGYWAQTDDGWTWVSYENFGWATYHYGRWTRLKDVGWAWVPGYDWGPGWVSWRTSDDYVGWAPLPPKVERGAYEGRVVDRPRAEAIDYNDVEPEDYGTDTDVQYDIGPQNYCFVETHNFGAPVLGEVCLPPERNFVVIEGTTNVTNIYRRRGPDRFVVYNHGPDFNFISAHSERPIQQLRIDRHDDLGFLRNGIRGGNNANQVRNGVFSVAAPGITRGPVNFAQTRPVRVKQTIDRPEIVHGWSHAGGDPNRIQQLRDKFKLQAQQAPPPRRDTAALPPRANEPIREREPANQPPGAPLTAQPPRGPVAGPRQPLTDEQKAARRDAAQRARDERVKAAGGNPAAPGQPPVDRARGADSNSQSIPPEFKNQGGNNQNLTPEERKARRAQQRLQQQGQPPVGAPGIQAPGQPPVNPASADADKAARRAQRQQEKAQQAQQEQKQEAPQIAPPNPDREARRAQRQQEKAAQAQQAQQQQAQQAPPVQQQQPQAAAEREARRAQHQQERAQQAQQQAQQAQQSQQANAEREARRAQRQQEQAAAQQRAPQAQAQNPEREARREQRQPQQAAPQRQPENAPQQAKDDDDKKKKHGNQ